MWKGKHITSLTLSLKTEFKFWKENSEKFGEKLLEYRHFQGASYFHPVLVLFHLDIKSNFLEKWRIYFSKSKGKRITSL